MRTLTVNDLCGYLPYGLKVEVNGQTVKLVSLNLNSVETWPKIRGFRYPSLWHVEFKPLLRPLSQLTEEITVNGETFVPIEKINSVLPAFWKLNKKLVLECSTTSMTVNVDLRWTRLIQDHLLSWYFDIFNLIPDGLAIPITDK